MGDYFDERFTGMLADSFTSAEPIRNKGLS
jgi:hypothetical protein